MKVVWSWNWRASSSEVSEGIVSGERVKSSGCRWMRDERSRRGCGWVAGWLGESSHTPGRARAEGDAVGEEGRQAESSGVFQLWEGTSVIHLTATPAFVCDPRGAMACFTEILLPKKVLSPKERRDHRHLSASEGERLRSSPARRTRLTARQFPLRPAQSTEQVSSQFPSPSRRDPTYLRPAESPLL